MNKLLVILGATSTGKTDLALRLASLAQGELVSCDSRQVYKGLDIGTGKLPSEFKIKNLKLKIERGDGWWKVYGEKIWLYDVVDPNKQYTVYDYVKDANRVIAEIRNRGKLPIIVGGTGLYLKALLEGLPNLAVPVDQRLRQQLQGLSLSKLQEKLQKSSPSRWEKMNYSDRHNPRRLIRAIEVALAKPEENRLKIYDLRFKNTLKIGLTAPRDILYQRIDARVISRINQGMIQEAEDLHKSGLSFQRMKRLGLEYGMLADYLAGKIASKEDLIKQLTGKIHAYARRQITWFKKETGVYWFDITKPNWQAQVERKVKLWYHVTCD